MCVNKPENLVKEPFDSDSVGVHVFMVLTFNLYTPLAQRNRALRYGRRCQGFESSKACQYGVTSIVVVRQFVALQGEVQFFGFPPYAPVA